MHRMQLTFFRVKGNLEDFQKKTLSIGSFKVPFSLNREFDIALNSKPINIQSTNQSFSSCLRREIEKQPKAPNNI